jgi:hypothetical protein
VSQCDVIDTLQGSRSSLSLESAAKVTLTGWRMPTYDLPILTDGTTCEEVFKECGVQLRDKSVAISFRYRLLVLSHLGVTAGDSTFITFDACKSRQEWLTCEFLFRLH